MRKITQWVVFTVTVGSVSYISLELLQVNPVILLPDWLFRTVALSLGFGAGLTCSEYK